MFNIIQKTAPNIRLDISRFPLPFEFKLMLRQMVQLANPWQGIISIFYLPMGGTPSLNPIVPPLKFWLLRLMLQFASL